MAAEYQVDVKLDASKAEQGAQRQRSAAAVGGVGASFGARVLGVAGVALGALGAVMAALGLLARRLRARATQRAEARQTDGPELL